MSANELANELAKAQSPYLRQHKDNPVHWREWGDAAFAEAAARDVPVLLSVGYAACHWCHVMAHESFEDVHTAELMNANFVSIKVDREERPDVDQLYMKALHLFGQHGGWPLTMFLTPKGEPFWGGTYFPPTPRHGRPSFNQVLAAISKSYGADPGSIARNVEAILEALREQAPPAPGLTRESVDRAAAALLGAMDPVNGGLKGAPKFPNFPILECLWRAWRRGGDPRHRDAVLLTLRRMCLGGIHDHLGGGFARYSVDERWLAPHFEKMLYDNALLLPWLALAARETGEALFLDAAENLVGWLTREMVAPGGAFASSLDADSDGGEGRFYTWTTDDIAQALDPTAAKTFSAAYDVTERGNWQDDHGGPRGSILNRLDTGDAAPMPTELRDRLMRLRDKRPRPARDDKALADWNALAVIGLARAGALLVKPEWIKLAESIFARCLTLFQVSAYGSSSRLGHSWRGDVLVKPGFAGDHAAMALAAVALFEASQNPDHLRRARGWLDELQAKYTTASGMLATIADDATPLAARLAPTEDDATPNPHALAFEATARLAALTEDARLRARLDEGFAAVASAVAAAPTAHCGLLNAFDLAVSLKEALVAGEGEGARALFEAARAAPWLGRTLRRLGPATKIGDAHVAAGQIRTAGKDGAVFVCSDGTCGPPLREPHEVAAALS